MLVRRIKLYQPQQKSYKQNRGNLYQKEFSMINLVKIQKNKQTNRLAPVIKI